jgi:2-C-methyl-D-erythritol 2,4-cyclodiphosphate synthase
MRVGLGYDSHAFDEERELVLGGVRIPDVPGLAGFSDGDAVAHAVTDAVLGAAALGDIGRHFPPGDERWRDADSVDLLRRVSDLVRERGYRVGNVDGTVICERPRIAPHADRMSRTLADALGMGPNAVSVKGKTNEGMGWEGTGKGIAVHAVALLIPRSAGDG